MKIIFCFQANGTTCTLGCSVGALNTASTSLQCVHGAWSSNPDLACVLDATSISNGCASYKSGYLSGAVITSADCTGSR